MVPIADAHSDFLGYAVLDEAQGRLSDHADIVRMCTGGIALQGFAVWVPPEAQDCFALALQQIDHLDTFIKASGGCVRLCTTPGDMESAAPIKAVLTIESGESIDCDLCNIQRVYDMGARMMSLTWNEENAFAHGCGSVGGLKPLGIEAVSEMNRLGVALDVSHISEQGFWDAVAAYNGAPCASHSCVYDLAPNPRNLKKDQIEYIIESGGYIGINFYTEFLRGRTAFVSDILDHIEYVIDCGGEDNVGFGSDFCGIQYTPEGLDSVADFQKVPAEMARRGYRQSMISKICCGNFTDYILKFLYSDNT